MLIAEGFDVVMEKVRRPHVLRVSTEKKLVWSMGLRRPVPSQKELAEMIHGV